MLITILLVFAFVLFCVSAYLSRPSVPQALLAGGLACWVASEMVARF